MKFTHLCLMAFSMAAILLVIGCAGTPTAIELEAARPAEFISGAATLSDSNNPADMAASAVYTKLAMYRRLAVKKLKAGDIDSYMAKSVQRKADILRGHLAAALANGDLPEIKNQSDAVNYEYTQLEAIHAH